MEIAPDGADEHFAGVEADTDLDRDALDLPHARGVSLHRLLHPQRGVARAHRVILVRQRGAEQRHDPVAHHLVHRALVPVDGLHHVLDDGVEQLAGVLGIAVGEELHRALEIGEKHGHLLALALERRF